MDTATYNAEPELKQPKALAQRMLRELLASRELAWRLFLRDLKARYRQSLLGYFWVVFPPLALTGSFFLMQQSKLLDVGKLPVPYVLYALTGMLFWQAFSDAVMSPIRIVSQAKTMLVKLHFPRESLILAAMLEVSFTFLIRILIFLPCLLFMGFWPQLNWLLILPVFFATLGTGTALGVALTPPSLLFEDFSQGLPLLISFLLICTPVAYIPQSGTLMATINQWNPLTYLIEAGRGSFLDLNFSWPGLTLVSTAAIGILLLGWILYQLALPHIIARIGS